MLLGWVSLYVLSKHNFTWAPLANGVHGKGPQGELLKRLLKVRGNRNEIKITRVRVNFLCFW